ncbi:DNA polymerase IV [Candidatus Uhrbacteria bacterium]|nr:DNA polymerase IV [Candidatus Uhrbacteria bacterium]
MNRIILHIDMNSYFASVEQQANPFLRGKPIGITGKHQERSIVATASIEAKRLGVKTAMSTWEAKKICPSIILYPGDPEKYSDIMHRFNRIYRSFTDRVEEFSVDESFLDITQEAQDYFGATCMAQSIRARLKEALGEYITASIGIAPNRLMAKLASESVKPNGLTVARENELLDLLDRSDLEDLCGIGSGIRERLGDLGINTFRQLREFPLEKLVGVFHSYGRWLHEAAWGRENEQEIASDPEPPKSYGHSYTLPENTNNLSTLKRYLLGLADKVAWRMRRDGVAAHRVSAYVRFADFSGHGEQRTSHEPLTDGLTLFEIAWRILRPFLHRAPVRLLGITASMISSDIKPTPLFKKDRHMRSVLSSLDQLQHRYGAGIWKRASTLPVEFKSRSSGFHFDHEL